MSRTTPERRMRPFTMRWALLVLLGLGLLGVGPAAATLSAAPPPSRMRLGKPARLQVTHTTRIRVEEGTQRLHVFHAVPQRRAWPGLDAPLAPEKATFAPSGATETATRSEGGFAWKWETAAPPAGEVTYVSTFELVSVDRELQTSGLNVRWADLPAHAAEVSKGLPALPTPNDRIREAAARIRKKSKDVVDALTAFTQWVSQNVAYTPGAAWRSDDLEAICRAGGGHCGHRATVFLALCEAVGIPARRVVGYALLNHPPGGAGGDDGNRHVWVQVSLPTIGWVEVEPAPHGSPFALSRLYVMTPFDLQARFVDSASASGAPSATIVSDTLRVKELR